MTRRQLMVSVVCVCAVLLSGSAASRADDVEDLHKLLDGVENAWDRQDLDALGECYTDEGMLVIVDPQTRPEGAVVTTKPQALAAIAKVWERHQLRSHRFVERDIDVKGDVAWLRLTIADRFRGRDYRTVRVLAVVLRREGRWKMCFGMPLFVRPVVVVTAVDPDSLAGQAGIEVGDVVCAHAGQKIGDWRALEDTVESRADDAADTRLPIAVQRGYDRHWLEVAPGPLGVRLEDRLLPTEGAVLIGPDRPHPIKKLIREQIDAVRAEDVERFCECLYPRGFLALWNLDPQEGTHTVVTHANLRQVVTDSLQEGREEFDYASASAQGIRLVVNGDVALASWRFELAKRGEDAGRMSVPTHLQAYVRQDGKWWLAAELPARIERGSHVDVVAYESPEQRKRREESRSGRFLGFGIQAEAAQRRIRITKVFPDTGAADAGLKAGEIITHIDGKTTFKMSIEDFLKLAKGREGTAATLKVRSAKGGTRTVEVTRRTFIVTGVESRTLPGDIGVIRFDGFNQQTVGGLRRALDEFSGKGAAGIVLDLRGNAGGLYPEVVKSADLFIPAGQRLWLVRQGRGKLGPVKATTAALCDLPVVVLIGEKTRSGGELLASALKQNQRATLVGQRTSGLAAMKERVLRPDGSSEIVKRGEFLAAPGVSITGRGVDPDVAMPPDATPDQVLDRAVNLLRAKLNP